MPFFLNISSKWEKGWKLSASCYSGRPRPFTSAKKIVLHTHAFRRVCKKAASVFHFIGDKWLASRGRIFLPSRARYLLDSEGKKVFARSEVYFVRDRKSWRANLGWEQAFHFPANKNTALVSAVLLCRTWNIGCARQPTPKHPKWCRKRETPRRVCRTIAKFK